jgi:F0F1-type ATP synthase assembly protein I
MAEDTPEPGGTRPRPETADAHQPSGSDVGWGITGTLLSGIIVWGGAGLALDRWLGTRFLVLVGLILGLGVAIYLIVMKYAPPVPPHGGGAGHNRPGGRRSRPGTGTQTQKGQR